MNKIKPSDEQKAIIDLVGNIVVIANPGSGKTTTLALKIANIIQNIKPWKGIIAISYTNKASDELKNRVNQIAHDNGNSFFGTIDKFYLSQIILPFFKSMYGISTETFNELEIVNEDKVTDIDFYNISEIKKLEILISLLQKGKLVLEYISDLAAFVLEKSNDCKKYLKARYEYICIDEYQDCNEKKHKMFIDLVEMGIVGIAVGDPNQSIFGFAGSNSKYLLSLTLRDDFITKSLNINRRSHEQITNYSLKFLDNRYNCSIPKEIDKRIHLRKVNGNEDQIVDWIEYNIETIMKTYNVENYSDIAILTLKGKTAKTISEQMSIPNKYFVSTPLDESSLYTDIVFKYLIMYIYGHENIYIEDIIEENLYKHKSVDRVIFMSSVKREKKKYLSGEQVDLIIIFEQFKSLFNHKINTENIEKVLSDATFCNSYIPLTTNEISILTTYKSKGLEYKIVFILDHYKYILPAHDFKNKCFASIDNDRNVHYVAITRAKDAVFFLVGNKRTNSQGEEKKGVLSEFLDASNVQWGNLSLLRTNK